MNEDFTNLLENLKNSKGNITLQKKVSIIGCNENGVCCAVALMYCNVVIEICLIDHLYPGKANAAMLDLENCTPPGISLSSSSEIEGSSGSDICVICFDKITQNLDTTVDWSRMDSESLDAEYSVDIVQSNIDEYKKIIPIIVERSPNTVFIIVTYPSTTMSYAAYKYAKIPINRIIGMGTALDTIEFQTMIANDFGVATSAVTGYIVGTLHVKITLWSEVKVTGTTILDIDSELSMEAFYNYAQNKFMSRRELYKRKGHPFFSNGTVSARLAKAVLTDTKEIFTVSCKSKGFYGIPVCNFLSLPCIIGANGVHSIVTPMITPIEMEKIKKASEYLLEVYKEFKL